MMRIALMLVLCPAIALASNPKSCVTAEEVTQVANKDVCVTAHVYDVVELPTEPVTLTSVPPKHQMSAASSPSLA